MKISVVGTGYVGLVTGACFSELGVSVVCVDQDVDKIEKLKNGECPIYEVGLPELLERNIKTRRLSFSTNLRTAVADSSIVFICVNTPSRQSDGSADLSDVNRAAEEIAKSLTGYTVIAVKSTVPVGTGKEVKAIIQEFQPTAEFDVASNPEFLSEGSSVHDFLNPSRIVIGVDSERAKETLRELYLPFSLQGIPILYSKLETAEMIKYASNAFLAAKVTFINEIADLCEQTGVDVRDLAAGIGLDERIGTQHLRPGPGYGGLCFPKDTTALVQTAKIAGSPVRIIETVVEINNQRKINMAKRVETACGGSVENKTVAMLGLTFKPGTDDLRDSPSIAVITALQKNGASIQAHDPLGVPHAREILENVSYFDDVYAAIDGADVVVIATAWNLYGNLDLDRLKKTARMPVVVDFHNLYDAVEMHEIGFDYIGIGQGHANRLSRE